MTNNINPKEDNVKGKDLKNQKFWKRGYSPFPNEIFQISCTWKPNKFRLFIFLLRMTAGFENNGDKKRRTKYKYETLDNFKEESGIPRKAISTYLSELEKDGFIIHHKGEKVVELVVDKFNTEFRQFINNNKPLQNKKCQNDTKTEPIEDNSNLDDKSNIDKELQNEKCQNDTKLDNNNNPLCQNDTSRCVKTTQTLCQNDTKNPCEPLENQPITEAERKSLNKVQEERDRQHQNVLESREGKNPEKKPVVVDDNSFSSFFTEEHKRPDCPYHGMIIEHLEKACKDKGRDEKYVIKVENHTHYNSIDSPETRVMAIIKGTFPEPIDLDRFPDDNFIWLMKNECEPGLKKDDSEIFNQWANMRLCEVGLTIEDFDYKRKEAKKLQDEFTLEFNNARKSKPKTDKKKLFNKILSKYMPRIEELKAEEIKAREEAKIKEAEEKAREEAEEKERYQANLERQKFRDGFLQNLENLGIKDTTQRLEHFLDIEEKVKSNPDLDRYELAEDLFKKFKAKKPMNPENVVKFYNTEARQ